MLQLIDKYGNVYGEGPIIITTKDGKLKTNVAASTSWGSITGILSNQTDLQSALNAKQATLVSGTNIKTINGSSILGSGNLVITGGVSSVSGVSPIASSGGATPSISIATANGSTTGALTFTDWNTFNNKENAIAPGTISQYWRGDKTWQTFPTIPTVNPSALTKTDDTNVTLTLGGSPSNALLQGVSLTLGWTGTLADSRISSAATWNAKQDAITLTTTGTSGAATLVGSTLNIPQYSGGSSTPINIQVFTSNGVWTKPANARQVEVYLFGAGGGGGSGRRGAASSARYGGGGAGTGSVFINKLDASVFAATENIWIGSGGTGAAAITVDNTNGSTGQGGGICLIGGNGSQVTAKIICPGGTGGAGGTATAIGSNTVPGQAIYGVYGTGQYGTSTSNPNGFTGNALFTMRPLTSGTFGGGIDATNVRNAGQSLQNRDMTFNNIYLIAGGSAAGAAGNNGTSTTTNANFVLMSIGGTGGAAGDTAGTIAGGTGGNGAICCGGGGGGASTNGANSGAGGNGGNGYCIMITYF